MSASRVAHDPLRRRKRRHLPALCAGRKAYRKALANCSSDQWPSTSMRGKRSGSLPRCATPGSAVTPIS